MKKIAIFGSSGHAGDVADIAIDNGYDEIVFLSNNKNINQYRGYPVFFDNPKEVKKLNKAGYKFAIGIGEPKIREIIYMKYPALTYPTLTHSSVSIGNIYTQEIRNSFGSIFAAGSRITNNITVGNFCFIGVNSVLGHDCTVNDFVSIMPSAVISGNVFIQKGAYIGCNASIRQGNNNRKLSIGKNSTIGMGAVVLNDIPDNNLAIGVPAVNSLKD